MNILTLLYLVEAAGCSAVLYIIHLIILDYSIYRHHREIQEIFNPHLCPSSTSYSPT